MPAIAGAWIHGSNLGWQVLNIGAGGQLRGISIANDGGMVTKADVGGGYYWDTTKNPNQWRQLVTTATMPVGTWAPLNGFGGLWEVAVAPSDSTRVYMVFNNQTFISSNKGLNFSLTTFPAYYSDGFGLGASANGGFAFSNQKIGIDPANPNVVYLVGNDSSNSNNFPQRSFDGGTTVAAVAGLPAAPSINNGVTISNAISGTGGKIRLTISNDASLLCQGTFCRFKATIAGVVGVPANGDWTISLFDSTHIELTGSTFSGSYVSGGTLSSDAQFYLGGAGIVFDASSGTTVCPSGGGTCTKTIYIPIYGSGVWQSTNAGSTWSQIANGTSSPIKCWNGKIDSSGVYYCSDQNVSGVQAWMWRAAAWTTIDTDAAQFYLAIVTDPSAAGRYIISSPTNGGQTGFESLDYGSTFVNQGGSNFWSSTFPAVPTRTNVSTDIPWLALADTTYMTIGDMVIDPSVPTFSYIGSVNNSTTITGLSSTTGLHAGQFVQDIVAGTTGHKVPSGATIISVNTVASSMVISSATTGGSGTPTLTINDANILFPEGIGVWKGNWPQNFVGWNWASQSRGIEELVARYVLAPVGCNPLVANDDRGVFQSINNQYPSTNSTAGAFSTSYDIDYATTDSTFVAAIVNDFGTPHSGYSSACGAPGTWTVFPNAAGTQRGGTIAVASHTNMVWIGANNQVPYYTLDAGASAWQICQLSGGGALPTDGWIFADFLFSHPLASDKVNSGVYYVVNWVHGIYKSIDGGQTWTLYDTTIFANGGDNVTLKAVPGHAGELWFTTGNVSGSHPNPGSRLYHIVDSTPATLGGALTITNATGVLEPQNLGIGAAKPGGSGYPSLYINGWVGGTAAANYAVWRSDDAGVTWTNLGQNPNNSMDSIVTLNGDMNTWGKVYVGFAGTGFAQGQFNFLLKRDLNPSNDNTPAFINQAA